MKKQIPLVGPSNADDTFDLDRERTINFIPEVVGSTGARDQLVLRTHGGLTPFCTGLEGAIRGIYEMGDLAYLVAGQSFYRVNSDGIATNLGTVLGSGRCIFADNFIPATRRQLVIMTGDRGYMFQPGLGLFEITDSDFTERAKFQTAAFLDGYIGAETGSGFIFSAIADALDYDGLDFVSAESSPDKAVAIYQIYGYFWLFGTRTIEVFQNTGDVDNPFQRTQTIPTGCGARYSVQTVDNTPFWLDKVGRVWRASGFAPQRVSTHAIEQYLASVDFSNAISFGYTDRGHEFYCLTVADRTFLYDVATNLWHERRSEDLNFWRANCAANVYGFTLFGDYSTGTIWKLDLNVQSEGDYEMPRERITGYSHLGSMPIFHHTLDLVCETGKAPQTGVTDPVLEMRYSDDGGRNWSNWKQRSIGQIGEYRKRLRWHRLGRTRQRLFHFRIVDAVKCDLIALYADFDGGDQA